LISVVGLVMVAFVSVALVGGRFDLLPLPGGHQQGGGGDARTPNPTQVFTPSPPPSDSYQVKGSILFVKSGSIWELSGGTVTKVASPAGVGPLAQPTWSPDGRYIYYIQYRSKIATGPTYDGSSAYQLVYPVVMRMSADGKAQTVIQNGLYSMGGGRWFFAWYLQPDVSPNGKTFALISDAPNPLNRDVVLALLPTSGGKVTALNTPEYSPFGHNDPAWSPDGTRIAFTYNARNGSVGTPRIAIYDVARKRTSFLTGPGYAQPAWSPDGRWIVADRTDGKSRDLVILSATSGAEVARLTNDGRSFMPTWSPDGQAIIYLDAQGSSIDLQLAVLKPGNPFSLKETRALTEASQLDGSSRPAWFIPPDQLPTPPPASPSTTPSGSPTGP
jgi:Tol biopolymer transport system component